MIDLTLDSVKIPAISGYTPPFGTKIVTTETNKGGLSTREVTEDVIKPFVKQRAVIITQDETTSTIEADSKIVVNGANATLTLGDGDEEGIELKIIAKESFILNCNSQNYPYYKGDIIKLIWDGDNWLNNDENNIGDIKTSSKIIDDTHPAPLGWLLCDGREVSKSTYSSLYEVIGDSQGTASSTENFILPNLKGRFLQGADENLLQSIEAGLPNITGKINNAVSGNYYGYFGFEGGFSGKRINGVGYTSSDDYGRGEVYFSASGGETKTDGTLKSDSDYHIYGKSDTVQPPAFTVNYLIRY